MKPLVACLFLLCPLPIFAVTPLSLANKVYRKSMAIASIRQMAETTIVFQANGRFVTLVNATGTTVQPTQELRKVYLRTTVDGTYVYQRVSDSEAHADLSYDDGTTATVNIPADTMSATSDFAVQLTDLTTLSPVTNLSLRGHVEPGHPLIAGFVVGGAPLPQTQFVPAAGEIRREVLIRAVGPGLTKLGVAGVWADPDFQLYSGSSPAFVNEIHYADWTVPPIFGTSAPNAELEAEFRKIFNVVGAFGLDSASKDAAAVVRLNSGAYTIVCAAPAGDPGGEVLIEVYVLP